MNFKKKKKNCEQIQHAQQTPLHIATKTPGIVLDHFAKRRRWRRFKILRHASKPSVSTGEPQIATDVCTRTLATYTRQLNVRCAILGKLSRHESKSSKRLHPASLPMKTTIWCCFAAGVDVAMLESEVKACERRVMVWS